MGKSKGMVDGWYWQVCDLGMSYQPTICNGPISLVVGRGITWGASTSVGACISLSHRDDDAEDDEQLGERRAPPRARRMPSRARRARCRARDRARARRRARCTRRGTAPTCPRATRRRHEQSDDDARERSENALALNAAARSCAGVAL